MTIANHRPAYRVLAPAGFFGPDDHLYAEGSIIYFDDDPNEEMEPMNDLARERQAAYFAHLDELGRKAAEKMGRVYAGRPKTLDDAIAIASQDKRRVQLVDGDGGVPLMGAKRRGRPRIERVDAEPAPETGAANPMQRRGPLSA